MNNLISISDFKGEFYLSVDEFVSANFDDIVEFRQKKVLQMLLGSALYADFDAGIQEATPEQKWLDLRDGANFTNDNGQVIAYEGLKDIVLYFTYYFYKKDRISFTTETGEERAMNINSNVAPESYKMVQAWAELVPRYGVDYKCEFSEYQSITRTVKPYDLAGVDRYLGGTYQNTELLEIEPSAYNFIYYTNKAVDGTYPDWIFRNIGTVNRMGL